GSFAQPGRAEDQHMIQRFPPLAGGMDEDLHLLPDCRLADVLRQRLGADGMVQCLVVRKRVGGDQTIAVLHGFRYRTAFCRARRMICSVVLPSALMPWIRRADSAGL